MKVKLYNKNRHIMNLEMTKDGCLENVLDVVDEKYLPIMLRANHDLAAVKRWMDTRTIPETRDGYKEVRTMFPRTAAPHNMFSLSDQYWFKWDKDETWEKGNFFTNRYDTDFGRMFFTPWNVNVANLLKESPDMTTGGVCRKRWMQEKESEVSYMIKMGWSLAHQNPLAEVLSSITLEAINVLPSVRYTLTVDGLTLCSKCRNFVTEDVEFVPAAHIYHYKDREEGETVYQHLIEMLSEFGVKWGPEFVQRLVIADAVINNTDRNLNNFGFLRSVETGEIVKAAPLFDSGSAYFGGVGKSKLFDDDTIDNVVRRASKRTDFSKLIDVEILTETINDFPILSIEERERIVSEIKANQKRLSDLRKS